MDFDFYLLKNVNWFIYLRDILTMIIVTISDFIIYIVVVFDHNKKTWRPLALNLLWISTTHGVENSFYENQKVNTDVVVPTLENARRCPISAWVVRGMMVGLERSLAKA